MKTIQQILTAMGCPIFRPVAEKADGMGVVVHGDDAEVERPADYAVVTWIGSVEPENAQEGDIWEETE